MRVRRAPLCLAAVVLGLAAAEAGAAEEGAPRLFPHFGAARVDARLTLPQWEEILVALRRDTARLDACRADPACGDRPAKALARLLNDLAGRDRADQIAAVNAAVNAVPYAADADNFGTADRWQAPLAFLDGSGDCEDYAIAKYFLLRRLGMSDGDLRIVVYDEPRRGAIHAVLTATTADGETVLDNRTAAPGSPAEYAAGTPKYAVNASNRWVFVALGGGNERGGTTAEVAVPTTATPGQ